MRRLLIALAAVGSLLSGSAIAADMPVKGPVAVPVAPYNWTGFYLGISGGLAYQRGNFVVPTSPFNDFGGLVGVTAGYNWQIPSSAWVFGVEADASWTDFRGNVLGCTPNCTTKAQWLGTARARFGYAAWQMMSTHALLYVTGGWAFADYNNTCGSVGCGTSHNANGFVIGDGVELTVSGNMTVKAEYLYVKLDTNMPLCAPGFCGLPAAAPLNIIDFHNIHILRVGLNWRL